MTLIRASTSDFMTTWISSSTAMILWWLDHCQSWRVQKVIFSWKRLKLWVWDLNTSVKLIFSNVVSVWTSLDGMLRWIKGMYEVCWMQWRWIIANRWQLLDRRDRIIMVRLRSCWTKRNTLSSDLVLEFVIIWQSNALTLPSVRRKSWERHHSLTDKVEADRALPQRRPAICVELP